MNNAASAAPAIAPSTPTQADRNAAALQRAARAKLIAYRIDADTYEVPSASNANQVHIVRRSGTGRYDWSCSCAGHAHPTCQHRAVVVFAIEHGVHAVRSATQAMRAALCTNCRTDTAEAGRPYCAGCAHVLANREIVPVQAFEGAEKAVQAPMGTIVRLACPGNPLENWA